MNCFFIFLKLFQKYDITKLVKGNKKMNIFGVKFFYPSHEEENILNDMMGNGYLFRFEKVMKR